MIDWLLQFLFSLNLTWRDLLLGIVMFVVTFAASLAVASYVLVRLPATYFQESHARDFWMDRHRAIRWSGIILKNFGGLILVLLGILLSLPGVPGQGILTILIGIMLLDFPGKRRLENKLVGQPKVLQTINQLRAKFNRPPLVLD